MSLINGSKIRLAAAGVLAFASAGRAASAADVPTPLDEIGVTAEKRASTVQETPISIVAYFRAALADIGVSDSYGLANLTPGLTIQREFVGKVVNCGVGVESATIGSDPGVATQEGRRLCRAFPRNKFLVRVMSKLPTAATTPSSRDQTSSMLTCCGS